MKRLMFLLLFLPLFLLGKGRSPEAALVLTKVLPDSSLVFTIGPVKTDAESILGQAVKLTEDKNETKDMRTKRSLSYTSLEKEPGTSRSVNLYYTLTKHPNLLQARNAYSDILKSNTNLPGQSALKGIGDEAWYHTDNENFSVIIVRKADLIMLMKVNKLTKNFSLEALKAVSKRIVSAL